MNEYDDALKSLLRGSAPVVLKQVTGSSIKHWLNIEIPKREELRVDLLGLTVDEQLLQMELQSRPDGEMPIRMLDYDVGVFKEYGQFPRQIVLYVGKGRARMKVTLEGPGLAYRYELVDIRDLDGIKLLESGKLGDNVLAILSQLPDPRGAIDEIVRRISLLEQSRRVTPLRHLLTLSGLRGWEDIVKREVARMPIVENILDHKVLGPAIKRGLHEGELKGELKILRRLIKKRFGAIPSWLEKRLAACSTAELEAMSDRVLDAATLQDLRK